MIRIIDNFLPDPIAERELALKANYDTITHNGLTYPSICGCTEEQSQERYQIAKALGHSGGGKWEIIWRRYFKGEVNNTYIHSDSMLGEVTCILFLNPPEECSGGSAFWRNKLYGWAFNPSVADIESRGLKDTPEFFDGLLKDGLDESKWEMIDYAPMQFNRLIIFPSALYHSRYPQEWVGDESGSGRLIKVYFFQPEVEVAS